MKTNPARFTLAQLTEKLVDAQSAAREIQGLIESMEVLQIHEITVSLSTSVDEGIDRIGRFVRSGKMGIREARKKQSNSGPESGPEPQKPAPKRRKKPS